jgi:hypothetical protein
LKYARIADVCPTILEILGYKYDRKSVGRAMAEILDEAHYC